MLNSQNEIEENVQSNLFDTYYLRLLNKILNNFSHLLTVLPQISWRQNDESKTSFFDLFIFVSSPFFIFCGMIACKF